MPEQSFHDTLLDSLSQYLTDLGYKCEIDSEQYTWRHCIMVEMWRYRIKIKLDFGFRISPILVIKDRAGGDMEQYDLNDPKLLDKLINCLQSQADAIAIEQEIVQDPLNQKRAADRLAFDQAQ